MNTSIIKLAADKYSNTVFQSVSILLLDRNFKNVVSGKIEFIYNKEVKNFEHLPYQASACPGSARAIYGGLCIPIFFLEIQKKFVKISLKFRITRNLKILVRSHPSYEVNIPQVSPAWSCR